MIRVRAVGCGFRLRWNTVLRFYVDFDCVPKSAISSAILPGVRSFCMACAPNPSHMEVRNVSLRGTRKESGTLWKSWQAQCFVDLCQNVGRRVSFEGLRFMWQAQGICTMDLMF